MSRLKLAVLVSGGGSNLQAIIDACISDEINAQVALVVSNRKSAFALERAKKSGLAGVYIGQGNYPDPLLRAEVLKKTLDDFDVDLIVLAGYLSVVPKCVIEDYSYRIINIHPSLIPLHSGPGFYGAHVHKSVLDAGDDVSGATVHFVDSGIDTGDIIKQRSVPVLKADTVESLASRVLELEHRLLIEVLKDICLGQIKIGEEARQ